MEKVTLHLPWLLNNPLEQYIYIYRREARFCICCTKVKLHNGGVVDSKLKVFDYGGKRIIIIYKWN